MTGVEHKRGVALDADVTDAEKQRAGGFADSLDAKRLAARIVLANNCHEVGHITSFAATD